MPTNVQVPVRTVASVNPASCEVLREFACAGEVEVHAAVVRSRAAQTQWCEAGPRKRVEILREFQRLLCEKKSDVARLITREAGKPYVKALLTEVMVVLDAARFLIDNAYGLLRDEPVDHGNLAMKTKVGRIVREPYGVIGIISPWNYPFSIPATEAVAALVAGNAVVLKPSEFTSLVAFELASLLHAAGVPKDVFQVIPGDGATGAAPIGSGIDKLMFSGSVATGTWFAQAAAARLLPVVLELGGKDPMIVLDDAEVEVASSGAVWGAFVNAGQACLSVERCYVHRSLYDAFVAACVWTRNRARGEALARRIHAGTVMVNDTVSCFGISEAPHGGVKASGIGRTHGRFGLEEMVRIKYLDSDRLSGIKKVWWYGYGAAFARQMEGFLDLQFARGIGRRLRGMVRSAGVLGGRKL